ncbi:MAG: hypothetical protein ACYDH2_13250 [Anaerolineaceae bacterium]
MTSEIASRLADVQRFYDLLERLEDNVGGKKLLAECNGRMGWPQRGVYFFFEEGEFRSISGSGLRVVRVGTHALKTGSSTTLWHRLKQHRGTEINNGGNHRGSVFRHHVGTALANYNKWPADIVGAWPRGSSASKEIREKEQPYEEQVSDYIGHMPFLWLDVDDEPGPSTMRGFIERNSIALLSNYYDEDSPIDPTSNLWLGKFTGHQAIRGSGLWNVNHVHEHFDKLLFETMEGLIA